MMKATEIREKKRMAEALEEKAKAAEERAKAAASGASEKSAEADQKAPDTVSESKSDTVVGPGIQDTRTSVKDVSTTIAAFEANYPRPISTLWKSPLNNMLQTTHLSVVNLDFKYDALFGHGFLTLMDLIMESYPVAGEGDKITDALISALDFDPKQVRDDSAAIKAAVEGKTEADLLAAAASGSGAIGEVVALIKSRDPYFHSQPGNIGLLSLMEAVSVKTDKESIERWAEPFGYRTRPLENFSGLLKEYRDKMGNAMQMMKATEIREKKRMAEALEEKAKAAEERAKAAASGASEKSAEADQKAPDTVSESKSDTVVGSGIQDTRTDVKSVSTTIAAFEANYPRPISTLWKSPLNNMLQTTHLSVVNLDFKYDALFGHGFLTLMDLIMESYPVAGEGDKITDALISALDFDPKQVRDDSAAIKAAVEGKTEADLLAATSTGSGAIGEVVAVIKSRDPYFHTQPGNIGLLSLMDAVSVATDTESIERW